MLVSTAACILAGRCSCSVSHAVAELRLCRYGESVNVTSPDFDMIVRAPLPLHAAPAEVLSAFMSSAHVVAVSLVPSRDAHCKAALFACIARDSVILNTLCAEIPDKALMQTAKPEMPDTLEQPGHFYSFIPCACSGTPRLPTRMRRMPMSAATSM